MVWISAGSSCCARVIGLSRPVLGPVLGVLRLPAMRFLAPKRHIRTQQRKQKCEIAAKTAACAQRPNTLARQPKNRLFGLGFGWGPPRGAGAFVKPTLQQAPTKYHKMRCARWAGCGDGHGFDLGAGMALFTAQDLRLAHRIIHIYVANPLVSP